MMDNSSQARSEDEHVCKFILYQEMFETFRVRVWDVLILVPNLAFLLYLLFRFNRARLKLRATSSPIFLTFYVLVCVNVVMSIFRCLVSMILTYSGFTVSYLDTILWVTVRFFLLSTEMSVVIFGLAFGHLDSRSSIRHVLTATSSLSLIFSLTQAGLELLRPDPSFRAWFPAGHQVFGHGGMLFWLGSSLLFSLVYMFILCLPWTRFRDRLALPTKRSFYVYVCVLLLLNLAQAGGALLLLGSVLEGICLVDATSALYFSLFIPLLYFTFLREFFGVSQAGISFSYNEHQGDEDSVSLPHQQSFSSLKTDSDFIYQHTGGSFSGGVGMAGLSSTHFTSHQVLATPTNPLYSASLQSPDSITGYSLNSHLDHPAGR